MGRVFVFLLAFVVVIGASGSSQSKDSHAEYVDLYKAVKYGLGKLDEIYQNTNKVNDQKLFGEIHALRNQRLEVEKSFNLIFGKLKSMNEDAQYLIFEKIRDEMIKTTKNLRSLNIMDPHDRKLASSLLNTVKKLNEKALYKVNERNQGLFSEIAARLFG